MSTCVAEEQLQRFLHKVEQLNALVALIEADPQLRARLARCDTHQQVVDFASTLGLEIGRRWGKAIHRPPVSNAICWPATHRLWAASRSRCCWSKAS